MCLSTADGAAVALPGRVAGAYLHRIGQEQEEPVLFLLQQRDSLSAPQTAGGGALRLHTLAALAARPSDGDGDGGVRGRGGRYLHDSQPPQRRDPGLLHVLLLSDATRVSLHLSALISYQYTEENDILVLRVCRSSEAVSRSQLILTLSM